MTVTTSVETPGDAELISAVRGGDVDAYGLLFERHVEAARRLARQLVSQGDVEDLVSESFVKVLAVLQRGGGPDLAFRAYLLTSVRRLRVDRLRAASKLQPTDDMEAFDPGVPFRDTAVEGFESAAAARAFASLPERWQLVLWHTEVEGQKPADVALLLGMSANSVSALAYRAREGLRQAFLNEHVVALDDDLCRWTHSHLGGYVRNGLSRRDGSKVESHLGDCRTCMAIYLELAEVNSNLSGVLAPLVVGGAAAAYVTGGGAVATGAAGGLLGLLDRAKDFVLANSGVSTVAGVTAATVVAGVAALALQGPDARVPVSDAPPAALPGSTTSEPEPAADATRKPRTSRPTRDRPTRDRPARERTGAPVAVDPPGAATGTAPETSDAPTEAADPDAPGSSDPDAGPATGPTGGPTKGPTIDPTTGPATGPANDPAPGPANDPPPGPAPGPVGGPAPPPAPAPPDPAPPAPPPPPPPPPPAPTLPVVDLSLSVSVTPKPPAWEIQLTVGGLPAGGTAVVQVVGTNGVLPGSNLDSRCTRTGTDTAQCTLGGSGGHGPFSFRSRSIDGATLTFTVASTEFTDPAPGNNTVTVPID
jgi:RNA polymerase sigma factor (sigma-70 family)